MGKEEIIERLEEIAKHAVHVLGEKPFFMSLDDGIAIHEAIDILKSAQPEEFEWCHDCKEYDKERHCCHRWTKVIRQTIEDIRKEQSEIVMCKDCKHWLHEHQCIKWSVYGTIETLPNEYCNKGERRTDDLQ